MSVSTILRTVSGRPGGRPAKTLHEELDDLESRLDTQLDRVVEANGILRRFVEEQGLMDEFLTWQAMNWRDRRR